MSHYVFGDADEHPHEPTADANFNESVYVNGFEPERGFGGWMRIGNRVNEGHAEAQVCFYLPDGRIACDFRRPDIGSNDGFAAGGLRYEVLEPGRRVAMHYDGELMLLTDPNLLRDPKALFARAPREPARIRYELDGVSPIYGGEPADDAQTTMYGRDFSLGHFFQHTRTRGSVEIGDERWELDSFGWRDHSWGPRYWTNIWYYRLLVANFGEDRGMCLLKITGRDGVTRREGVLQIGDAYEPITDMDLVTRWTDRKDPEALTLGVRTANRAVRMEGRVRVLAPLSNRRKVGEAVLRSRIAEGLTEWSWDGRTGIGVTEYIEFLENGEPVGYPL